MNKKQMVKTLTDAMNDIACSTDIKGHGSVLFESYIDRYSQASHNIWAVLHHLKNLAEEEDSKS